MTKEILTQEKLKEKISYNPETGALTWNIVAKYGMEKGDEAGWLDKNGRTYYRNVQINGIKYKAHRLAWLYMKGSFPVNEIDHIDHDGTNNKWSNLRDVTHAENGKNYRMRIDNTSSVTGVLFHSRDKKWNSSIFNNGVSIYSRRGK